MKFTSTARQRTDSGCPLRRGTQQLRQPDQVVGRRRQREHPADPPRAAIARLALSADRLHPAEHRLDPFAHVLAYLVAGTTCGAHPRWLDNGSYRMWSPVSERAVIEPQLIPAIAMPRAMSLKSQSL